MSPINVVAFFRTFVVQRRHDLVRFMALRTSKLVNLAYTWDVPIYPFHPNICERIVLDLCIISIIVNANDGSRPHGSECDLVRANAVLRLVTDSRNRR